MDDAIAIAAHSGGLANAYRAALIAAPRAATVAGATNAADAARTALAAAARAWDSGSTPWSSPSDDRDDSDFATLLRARTRRLDTSTDPQARAFADAEAALAAGRIATRSLMALFGGSTSDANRSERDGDLFGFGMGTGGNGMASMFDGFIADIDAQLAQVMTLARQRRDALLATAKADGAATLSGTPGQRAVTETRRAG